MGDSSLPRSPRKAMLLPVIANIEDKVRKRSTELGKLGATSCTLTPATLFSPLLLHLIVKFKPYSQKHYKLKTNNILLIFKSHFIKKHLHLL